MENSELLECRQELKKKLRIVIHQNIVEMSLNENVIVFSEEGKEKESSSDKMKSARYSQKVFVTGVL